MSHLPLSMLKTILLTALGAILVSAADAGEKTLVIRKAQEFQKSTVAVEAYLSDNIMETKITARMYGTKPKIYNAIIVGPGLGRLSIESKEVLLASTEEDEPYSTSRNDKGFIHFGVDGVSKTAEGTLTRELLLFKIPKEKIKKTGKYRLWVQITSMQQGGKYKTFKFDLENFATYFK
jgi:hypothetical protein